MLGGLVLIDQRKRRRLTRSVKKKFRLATLVGKKEVEIKIVLEAEAHLNSHIPHG